MELKESDFKTLKWLPIESRNILVSLLKELKIQKSEQINKLITNNDIITFRNWVVAGFNVLIEAMQTEIPNKQEATLLTRQKVDDVSKKSKIARMETKTKK